MYMVLFMVLVKSLFFFDVSFYVWSGYMFGIIGFGGVGKSVFFKFLCGLFIL